MFKKYPSRSNLEGVECSFRESSQQTESAVLVILTRRETFPWKKHEKTISDCKELVFLGSVMFFI